jgi:hypothetical protein
MNQPPAGADHADTAVGIADGGVAPSRTLPGGAKMPQRVTRGVSVVREIADR